jgi:hypothetical protein
MQMKQMHYVSAKRDKLWRYIGTTITCANIEYLCSAPNREKIISHCSIRTKDFNQVKYVNEKDPCEIKFNFVNVYVL